MQVELGNSTVSISFSLSALIISQSLISIMSLIGVFKMYTKIAVIKIKKNVSYIFYTYMAYKYLAQ